MTYRILCIGNSHTAGFPHYDPLFGGDPYSSYQFWLKKKCETTVPKLNLILDNRGVCGQTTREIVSRLQQELERSHVEWNAVILWGGTNDVAVGYGPHEIYANLQKGVRIAQEKQLDVFVLTIPPINWVEIMPIIQQVNSLLEANSADHYYLVDVSALEKNGKLAKSYDAGDGAHLSSAGYRVVGELLCDILKRVLLESHL
jgi:lysophospholipase L1-like esterase